MMPKPGPHDPKREALKEQGALNPHPKAVSDSLFQFGTFFDARDLIQVKYEMLRRVQVEHATVTEAAATFGFSRVAFYQVQKRFEEGGLPGLLPIKRGPKEGHKLTRDVMEFLEKALGEDPSLNTAALTERVRKHFGLTVHTRSIERALARSVKKGR
jgi:transposase